MARTSKLTDIQLILLTTACQRSDGSLLPPPDSLGDHVVRVRKTIAALIKRNLAAEGGCSDVTRAWRTDGQRQIGVFVTDAGRALILRQPAPKAATAASVEETKGEHVLQLAPSLQKTKRVVVIEMLRRNEGAGLADLVAATGWLPHTTRAALTGLRKKGHAVTRSKVDGATRYHIAAVG